MGQATDRSSYDSAAGEPVQVGALDLVITNAVIVDWSCIYKVSHSP